MRPSSAMCREQERIQLDKAETEELENRRKIALTAAKAWAVEAQLAEKREAKIEKLDKLDAEIIAEFAREAAERARIDHERGTTP